MAHNTGGEASGPSPDWLEHARTPAARIAISRWLEAHPADGAEEQLTTPTVRTAGTITRRTADPLAETADTDPPGGTVRMARCCTPVPPDGITGFVIRGGTVAVHRAGLARSAPAWSPPAATRWPSAGVTTRPTRATAPRSTPRRWAVRGCSPT